MSIRTYPWRLCNSPYIFQEKMDKLFNDLKYVRTDIYDLLIISNMAFEVHINKLDKVLSKLKQRGIQVFAEKSFFAINEIEYIW